MAKKKNKYDTTHLKNVSSYERQIAEIYKEAVREAALLGTSVPNVDADKVFSFADYPITTRRINTLLDTLQRNVSSVIVNGINAEWTLSNEKNDELVNSVLGQAVRGLTAEQRRQYFSNNDSALQAFSERKVNGMNLSDRVWKYTDQFKSEIELGIDIGLREGRSAQQLSQDLRSYLQHPDKLFRRVRDEHGNLVLSRRATAYHPGQGVYRSSYRNAIRMTGTETNMAYRTADHNRWQQLDFVVGQEIHTSNNHTLNGKEFEDMCDELAGKYPKDFEFVGWHPNCRCYATSILKSREEMREDSRRIMNGEETLPAQDSVNYVPSVPKGFEDWVIANEERIARAKSMPYFLSNNAGVVNGILGKEVVPIVATSEPIVASRNVEEPVLETPKGASGQSPQTPSSEGQLSRSIFAKSLDDVITQAEGWNLEYNEVKALTQPLTEGQIIAKVGGYDRGKGSCASLALAYAGNKCGYDVIDFRGGKSREFFENRCTSIAHGVGGIIDQDHNGYTVANRLLKRVEKGKEYIFTAGEHCAIVRRGEKRLEYLDLQGRFYNGFIPFDTTTLKKRFGCKKSKSRYGMILPIRNCLIDIDLLRNDKDFQKLLGYINTQKRK